MTAEIRVVRIDELPGAGRLGRHVEHDARSLAYLVDETGVTVLSKLWSRATGILDQGDLGSCTGNAAAGALGCDPFRSTLPATFHGDEPDARTLYSEATELDSISGTYPPDDTGSTGLAVAKACKNAGLISGYQHATSFDALAAALQAGPVIVGMNWYSSFDDPDDQGLVKLTSPATVRGGHEVCVRGIDVEHELIHADNSWGSTWGYQGSFSFSFADCTRLLGEDGDCAAFVPLTSPPPQPAPNPPPPSGRVTNAELIATFDAWAATRRH